MKHIGIPAGFAGFENTALGKKGWKCNVANGQALVRQNDLSITWYSVTIEYDTYRVLVHNGVSISDYRKDEHAAKGMERLHVLELPSINEYGIIIKLGDALAKQF